jgi:YHS domain-containing protein
MEGLFSLLLFAGLLYFMMRFGCGAHAVHGHGGHGGHGGEHGEGTERQRETHPASTSASIDPVCGMELAPDKGYTKMYEGRQYRLCSRACLDTFEANPQQYATPAGGVQ